MDLSDLFQWLIHSLKYTGFIVINKNAYIF